MCLKSTSFELKVVGNVSPTMAAAVCGRLRDHNTRQDCLQMPAETKYRCARGINRRRTRASVGNIIGVGGNVVRKWGRAKRPRAGDAAITPAKRRARAKPETVQLRLPRWVAIFLRLLQDCWLSLQTNREHKRSSNTQADKQITSTNTAQKWTCACHLAFSCVVVSAPTSKQTNKPVQKWTCACQLALQRPSRQTNHEHKHSAKVDLCMPPAWKPEQGFGSQSK